jgi:DNA-binding response OmpR family regulator
MPGLKQLRKVMIVEDDPDIAGILELSLNNIDHFETTLFPDAFTALVALEEQEPDVLLMDVMMPGLRGVDALPKVRKTHGGRDCVVVFITANPSAELRSECLERGAVAVIAKPFDVVTLGATLKDIWQKHNNELPISGYSSVGINS